MAKKTILIAGNTRGPHETVVNRFNAFRDKLEEKEKYKMVHYPTVIGEPKATWNDSIRSDISILMTCDELHLMAHWQGHKRSEILRNTALSIGMHVVYH